MNPTSDRIFRRSFGVHFALGTWRSLLVVVLLASTMIVVQIARLRMVVPLPGQEPRPVGLHPAQLLALALNMSIAGSLPALPNKRRSISGGFAPFRKDGAGCPHQTTPATFLDLLICVVRLREARSDTDGRPRQAA